MSDITNLEQSGIDRQNILNNSPALRHVEKYLSIPGVPILGEIKFTVKQVAEYYDVDERTIKRYIEQYGDELKRNGYDVLTGKRLSEAKKELVKDINVPELSYNAPSLGLFSFRAFLNIGMLLTESQKI